MKTAFGLNEERILAFLYIPLGSIRYSNEEHFDVIENDILEFSNNDDGILISGDFNARTRTLPDFVQFDKDDIHTMHFDNVVLDVENLKPAIQLDRVLQDTGRPTNYGYKLLSLCKNNNLYIAKGRSGLDKGVGKLTCKNRSIIDYMLCSSI